MGAATIQRHVERFGSAAHAFDVALGDASVRNAALRAADALLADAEQAGAALWLRDDPAYPPALLDLPDPPGHLFALGERHAADTPVVAIVGTRSATAYGERVTRELAGALSRAGACVVSGLARGIDALAHRATLDARGRTIAVLGTGVDVPYPAGHADLHRAIAERGLVVSEHGPGVRATPGSFPRRNRVIAALAQVTIVVEAGVKSGALITAGHALDLGRTVAAVPGRIDAPQSAGANELLRDGAAVIAAAADAVALIGLTPAPRAPDPNVSGDERVVWDALAGGPLDLDGLAARSALPARRCLAAVTALEVSGAIECALTGEIRRR